MTSTDTDSGPISRERYDAVVSERENLKRQLAEQQTQVAQATKAAQTALARTKYLEHRASKDETLKPLVAELDIATPMLDGIGADDMDTHIATVAEKLSAFRGGQSTAPPPANDGQTPPPEQQTPPPNQQVPGHVTTPNPNPGANGAPAQPEVLDVKGRTDLVAKEGLGGVRAALETGAVQLSQEVRERHGL